MGIKENVEKILKKIPPDVLIVAATKTRTVEEINQAIEAGIKIIGENYVQEAKEKNKIIGKKVNWHMIGHLQKNKVKKAIEIFDLIQTLDNFQIAEEIDKYAKKKNIIFPVLVEINSASEPQKKGILPEKFVEFVERISIFENIKILGVMTMGPVVKNPEDIRQYFKLTRNLFEKLNATNLLNLEVKYLSMGMSDTWEIAIQEGANIVRIGTAIFGPRRGG